MKTTNLGFPNTYQLLIKHAVEGFWKGKKKIEEIVAANEKVSQFNSQKQNSLDLQPVFDIDTYDRLLRTAVTFGIVPERFGTPEEVNEDLSLYLSIPRGTQEASSSPMVKWFNTNYHIVQPEIEQIPRLVKNPQLPELEKRQKLALIGPCTLLSYALNKTKKNKEELFEELSSQYVALINNLPNTTIQLEEPSFLTGGIPHGYAEFVKNLQQDVHLHVYFGSVNNFAEELFSLPIGGIGLDFIEGPENLTLLDSFPGDKLLIAGIINGRNVWPVSTKTEAMLEEICAKVPDERLYISPSCSLQHLPLTADGEECKFSFALEKLQELEDIKNGTIKYQVVDQDKVELPKNKYERSRKSLWVSEIPFPTTTIGSFPQTSEIRKVRKNWKNGKITGEQYQEAMHSYIDDCIQRQEDLGLDVLVHGEPERADMVQYFAEHFAGFTPIKGAVQSYGTRLVRPPVVIGDIKRTKPFSVEWIKYTQSLTEKPVKGMLTGPVTLSQWSFPREDITREAQFYQFAEALAEEVEDLVKAGIKHIQIDEPALREGLPLDPSKRNHYLHHALNAFRRVYASIPDDVVIHSHMCFSEFPDIIDAIKEMGVDVLSIEDSKAQGKTALSLQEGGFPGSIGLGVYDVHSPRIPSLEEMVEIPGYLLKSGMDPRRLWINPDCGLKTRGIKEAYQQLEKMMEAKRYLCKTK